MEGTSTIAGSNSRIMLPTLSLSLVFEALDPVHIPGFSGSVWRGAFGYALKRVACVMRMRPCEGCPLEASCVYTTIFDTRSIPGKGLFTATARAPHPFALVPEADCASLAPGERFVLGLALAGPAAAWAPVALRAFAEAGERGIGRGRGRLALAEVRGHDDTLLWSPGETLRSPGAALTLLPPLPPRARLMIKTPLRLGRGGRLVRPGEFTLPDLITAVARRVSELSDRYGDGPLQQDFRALKEAARSIPLASRDLAWREFRRYSTRQRQWLPMGGIVGSAELDFGAATDAAEALWPFLILGARIGAGKAVTMGFGAYDVIATDKVVRDGSASRAMVVGS
jgi:hypothetical protein